jgi:hypothetical protein
LQRKTKQSQATTLLYTVNTAINHQLHCHCSTAAQKGTARQALQSTHNFNHTCTIQQYCAKALKQAAANDQQVQLLISHRAGACSQQHGLLVVHSCALLSTQLQQRLNLQQL